jgi:leader peptidase (prepilin peptidase)/N-methyltransferase
VFLVIIFIDWEHKLILNKITYPAAVAALIIFAIDSLLPLPGLFTDRIFMPETSILSSVIGGVIGSIFFLIVALIKPEGMGVGDIKLGGLIGLATGFPLMIFAVLIGVIIGGLVAVVLLLLKMKGWKDVIPYGTFLAIGPIIALLWGREILDWYIGFF